MVTTVGKDTISLKRNLKNIFPKEFTNRQLINEFITYILNNFFEKSQEKLISSYVGEVIPSIDGTDCYLSEPTAERQLNQIIPIVKTGETSQDLLTYSNFIANLHNEGCKINNENKLVSSKYWSWCPPINVDMFINYNNYYWVKQDPQELSFLDNIIYGAVDVEKDVIGKSSYEYFEVDKDGNKIDSTSIVFEDGMRVVFLNDTSKKYNNIPYIVNIPEDGNGYLTLNPVITPIIVIGFETNVVADIIDKPTYTFDNKESSINFELLSGMRLLFLNDANKEYNNIPYIVDGVGDKIVFIEDSYKSGEYLDHDYIVMERGCVDGNQWSIGNRWVHRSALEKFNTSSMDASTIGGKPLEHAHMPILCFNKNIELYDYGTFDRGYVETISDLAPNDLNGLSITDVSFKLGIGIDKVAEGTTILLLGNTGSNPKQLYTFNIMASNNKVVLKPKENGQTINGKVSDGSTVVGDSVKVLSGEYAGKYLFYNGYTWKEGQRKNGINDPIKFNLYDADGIALDNTVQYPNSTFKGCVLFDYMEDTSGSVVKNEFIGKPLVKDDLDKNYYFINHLEEDEFYYTPTNDYTKKINGYKFFKNVVTNEYLNDWYLSKNEAEQYIKTQVVSNDPTKFDGTTYKVELKYNISNESTKQPLLIYKNGKFVPFATFMVNDKDEQVPNPNIEGYYVEDKTLYLYKTNKDETFVIYLLSDDDIDVLDENYVYEYPLSLTTNQLNNNVKTIAYNNCFDQMIDIIQNQKGIIGEAQGSNNYSSIKADLSVGTKIVQSENSIIRTMILNNDTKSSIRNSISYVSNAYTKFKQKFMNVVNTMYIKGLISDDNISIYEATPYEMDSIIKDILSKINVGKEGIMPFYNNGITHLVDNAYIPSTPAYLGVANSYEPKIIEFTDYPKEEKPTVLVGHDGSYTKTTNTVKDLLLKRLEQLIYDSIQTSFKDKRCGINKLKFYPGKFRKNGYTRKEFLDTYSPLFEKWTLENKLDYSEHMNFDYSVDNKASWKTWNYTGEIDQDGEELYGSYRSIYTYYYDTHRPDLCPWEMLGFGNKPSWWEAMYGPAPYTSNNINMWKDIENGYISDGVDKGEYDELKRPGLVEKYIPVDDRGNLLSPIEIGIIDSKPIIQRAKARWNIGDIGEVEFAFMQTSAYHYTLELINYLLRPIEWVETNWDSLNRKVLFKGTTYEQTIDVTTNKREELNNTIMHNEYIDGKYVQKLGIQQWISDYLLSDNLSIEKVADKIRNATVKLGYRCAGYYQKGTLNITTDAFGMLPEENVHMNLFKSYDNGILTYSGMVIEKTAKGYIVDGFDTTYPYFKVKLPELNGQRSSVEENGKSIFYYHNWKDGFELIPYRKEYFTEQEIYNIIVGYGKYLEEEENWYFNTLTPSGEISNFRISASSFLRWSTTQQSNENIGNIILLNPGSLGIGNYTKGMVDDLGLKINGQMSVLDIYGNPIKGEGLDVFRQSFNTYVQTKDKNIGLVKLRTYSLEHLITLDNKTIFEDVLYNPLYSSVLSRMKISGVKVKNWYGDLYAPGYLIEEDGAIPNYDKKANDLQYMFNVDDVHCQGDYAKYSKGIIGYTDTKTYRELFKNNKSMFDFYKGSISEKGTSSFLNKLNRSRNISSSGQNIELFEKWAFKAGEFGHTSDNSIIELLLDTEKMAQNPQIITFENSSNYYYDRNKVYNSGEVVIYNNHEYKCIENNVSGEFQPNKWEMIRFVGNYIIFGEDKKWLKKQKNTSINSFRYTNDFTTNPIGGFPMTSDCEYIVFDENEFNDIKDQLIVGETVWIVKLTNGDWDVRKKTGINKFVSMRYKNLQELYSQKEYDYVYHFKDNNTDYYTLSDNETIELDTIIYDDIDCNNPIKKWVDINYPMYTGNVGEYNKGQGYKVKLYNTVFTTLTPEEIINNGSTLTEFNNNTNILSYSNLLLNMASFGSKTYQYKYMCTIAIDTKSEEYSITINGTEYKNPSNKQVSFVVCGGDVINWSTYAYGCGVRSGTINVANDGTEQPLNITVPMNYRNGYVIGEYQSYQNSKPLLLTYPGRYEFELVGAGGGAGGGSTKKKHKHAGNGGASGAYVHCYMDVTEADINIPYTLSVGSGGKGGANGRTEGNHGNDGGDTCIYKNGSIIIKAQGGAGAWGARSHTRVRNDRKLGYGGTWFINPQESITNINSKNGANGGLGRYNGGAGKSVYPKGVFGQGGTGVYKGTGHSGNNGYMKILYVSGEIIKEIKTSNVKVLTTEIVKSDSLDYSAYYQPYIVPSIDGKTNYFYSYDVLYADEYRPNADEISDSSKFYLNRSKSITAYHKNTVAIGNTWKDGSNIQYKVGDIISVASENNTFTCYICVKDNIATSTFYPTKVEGEKTIVYWKEYVPTYYYKITDNTMSEKGTEPTFTEIDYELYLDEECLVRATKNNEDFLLNCSDLDFNRNYTVGEKYTLVDNFATYRQLKPTFLQEPLWGVINSVGNYPITSGLCDYFVNVDNETIDLNDGNVYIDAQCTIPVQYITAENNGSSYTSHDLKYSDISNVKYDVMSPSYEIKDGDILMYTNKPNGEISENDIVYNEPSLQSEIGVYGDYIPKWDLIDTFKPNEYTNKLIYASINTPNFKDENGDDVEVYYEDEKGDYQLLMLPTSYNGETGEVDFNHSSTDSFTKIKLYKKNNDSFEQVTSPIYIKLQENVSKFYAPLDFNDDNINLSNENGQLTDIALYYDVYSIGKSINSLSIFDTIDEYENIDIMFTNVEDDPMYKIFDSIWEKIDNDKLDFETAISNTINEWNTEEKYIDEQEVRTLWEKYGKNKNYSIHIATHKSKIFTMIRNENPLDSFQRCYLYGDKFYIIETMIDTATNSIKKVANIIGTYNDITKYERNSNSEVLYNKPRIVNTIAYKEIGDYFYIDRESLLNASKLSLDNNIQILGDSTNLSSIDGTLAKEEKMGWMKVEYIDRDYLFDIVTLERKLVAIKNIKSCVLVNDETDNTIINVQLFDPIQNVIPNNVLDEVNYISSIDPVNNYEDGGKWNEQKIGYLWWDTSKVRYVDYHQGDYEYRRLNWGKQLPGSEIAIMEWTKGIHAPTDGRKYITRQVYNYETSSLETYYYYWEKNPSILPQVSFRKTTALVISSIINNPTEEGIIWVAPIDGNIYGKNENTMLLCNYNNVLGEQNAVLQINMDSDVDIMDHTEWALVKENAYDDIPSFLWDKMKDSLLGTKTLSDGTEIQIPNPNLVGRQRLGLSIRPMQTMFNKIVNARENFIDCVNDIFANRDMESINKELSGGLLDNIDAPTVEYMDTASNKLEMMSWLDTGLIGNYVYVKHDETLDGIWAVYYVENVGQGESGYKLVEYQKYDITNYLTYIDWYMDKSVKYILPTYTTSTSADAVKLVSTLQENSIVKYQSVDGDWELWQLRNNKGILEPTLVAQSNKLIQINESIYNYVYNNIDNEKPFITLYSIDGSTAVKVLTKYQYVYDETQYLLEQLVDYFNV